jgi:nicotinate-nucleotide pyrophosphorylase (carboxylating)
VLLGLAAGADILLLDNVAPARLARLVRWIRRHSSKTRLEVSGGVTLQNVGRIARAGVDRISIGRLTHSAPSLDINMDVEIL